MHDRLQNKLADILNYASANLFAETSRSFSLPLRRSGPLDGSHFITERKKCPGQNYGENQLLAGTKQLHLHIQDSETIPNQ